jgi:hypothetical protein
MIQQVLRAGTSELGRGAALFCSGLLLKGLADLAATKTAAGPV